MAVFLNLFQVQYECSCGAWYPLSYTYYCLKCVRLRCANCALEEVDTTYCSTCLDDTPLPDSKSGKGVCSVCYQCPVCSSNLVCRCQGAAHYLHCNHCQWTTTEAGLENRPERNQWPNWRNNLETKLENLLTHMRALATYERQDSEKGSRRSMSNLGHVPSDRYGMHQLMQARRKKLLQRPESMPTMPSVDAPCLDEAIFTREVDESGVLKLHQILKLPHCDPSANYPIHKRLHCRKYIRCPDHDVTIYRGEYSILKTQAKHYIPVTDFCPEVKVSGPIHFRTQGEFSILITVSNQAFIPMEISIEPVVVEDPNCVTCNDSRQDFLRENCIPNKDNTQPNEQLINLGGASDPDKLGTVVFRSGHRVGLHYKCRARSEVNPCEAFLLLLLKFKTQKAEREIENRVKIVVCPS